MHARSKRVAINRQKRGSEKPFCHPQEATPDGPWGQRIPKPEARRRIRTPGKPKGGDKNNISQAPRYDKRRA